MITKKEIAIQSAQTVSMVRAIAARDDDPSLRCGDYLAENFLDNKHGLMFRMMPQKLLKSLVHYKSPGSYCFMTIRTRHFDDILLNEIGKGIEQVVILGAGYDSRPLRFAEMLRGVRVFEIDFPGTQVYKMRKLEKMVHGVPGHVTFIPLDFNVDRFDKALVKRGFSPGLKTMFLWEGVSYYLPEPVVRNVLAFVSSCAPGSSILFDYATKDFVTGDRGTYGGRQVANWLKKIGEPFLFGLNADETVDFVNSCQLSVVSDYGPGDFEKMYLTGENGKLLGKTLGHVRMVHARVNRHS